MFCHVLFMSCFYYHQFFAFYLHHMLSDSIRLVYHLIIFSEPGNEWWWTNLIIIFLHLLYWNSAFIHILCNKNLPSLSIGLIKVKISKLRKQKWIIFFFHLLRILSILYGMILCHWMCCKDIYSRTEFVIIL